MVDSNFAFLTLFQQFTTGVRLVTRIPKKAEDSIHTVWSSPLFFAIVRAITKLVVF